MPALKHCTRSGEWKELAATMQPNSPLTLPSFPAANSLRTTLRLLGYRVRVRQLVPGGPEYTVTILP
jgi:hypothetical protein